MPTASKYHLGKTSYVLILMESLKEDGVNIQSLINKSSLRYFKLNDPEAMLPIPVIYEFFELVENNLGIDQMAVHFQKDFSLIKIGAYGQILANSKKLLSGIFFSLRNEKSNFTHDNNELRIIDGKRTFYGSRYSGKPCKGKDFLSKIDHSMQLEYAKNSNEEGWCPEEIYVTGNDATYVEKLFPNCNSKILLNQDKLKYLD